MDTGSLRELARRVGELVLAPALALIAITLVCCWLVGWRTLEQAAAGLTIAGGLLFIVGAFGMLGGRALDGNVRYMTACSVSCEDLKTRKLRRLADNRDSFAFLLHSAAVAGLLFVVALVLRDF